jgi:serine protease AprX
MRRPSIRCASLALVCVAILCAPASRAAAFDELAASRLDPRLVPSTSSPEPVSAWVTFADKGERGPADLAAMLARAEAALTPANRARRLRAGLRPLVSYDDLPVDASYVRELRRRGLEPYGVSRWGNEVAVRLPGTRLAEIASLPLVARLRPVERARPAPTEPAGGEFTAPDRAPRDRALAAQLLAYGYSFSQLNQINVPAVHDSGFIGTGVTICVIDDGFNYHDKHEATRNADIPPGYERDFIRGLWTAQDTVGSFPAMPGSYSHGMWTFGCMAGNLPGRYIGSAPGARYALARTEYAPSETPQELVWWRMAAEWADSLGADVISSSLGYSAMDDPLLSITYPMRDGRTSVVSRAAEIAASKGILIVNSAGNDNQAYAYPENKVSCPGDVNGDSLVTVGAVYRTGLIAPFSSNGPTADGRLKPDVVADGVSDSLVSASGNANAYTTASGTSFSCPITAGLLACLIQARPAWPATRVIQALYHSADRFASPDTAYGRGIPNGLLALRWIPDSAVVPPAPPMAGFLRVTIGGAHPARPGRASTRVRAELGADAPATAPATLRVFDLQGRLVRDLWSGVLRRGEPVERPWDGIDVRGHLLRPGVYLVALEAAGRISTTHLVTLR